VVRDFVAQAVLDQVIHLALGRIVGQACMSLVSFSEIVTAL